jgi:uncharacterized cupredoxin-like copper-binding protein
VLILTACAQNTGNKKTDASGTTTSTIKSVPETGKPAVVPPAPAVPDAYKEFVLDGTGDYSFGTIDQDQTVEHTFVFKNKSKEMITIDNARASCGCTAAVITEKDVKPGGEGKIQVKFTPPKGTRGEVHKSVSVFLKGESNPHTVLRFSANVKTDLDIQPSYIQVMGAVAGEPVTGKTMIKNVSTEDLDITQLPPNMTLYVDTSVVASAGGTNSVPEPLTNVTVEPKNFKLKPGESRELVVTVVPQKRGQINGWVRIKTAKSEAMITVYGIVRPKTK